MSAGINMDTWGRLSCCSERAEKHFTEIIPFYIYKLKIYFNIPNKKNYIQTKTKLICKDTFIEIQRNSVTFSTVFEKCINPN